jgi:hypothetical protein
VSNALGVVETIFPSPHGHLSFFPPLSGVVGERLDEFVVFLRIKFLKSDEAAYGNNELPG